MELLIEKSKWIVVFKTCLDIYNGENKMFADVPIDPKERTQAMETYLQSMVH